MLTVMFATRNRADLLRDVLSSYTALLGPAGGWKLVVIDNGSTDGTGDVLRSFQEALPLTALRDERVGKNYALTTGVEAVAGDLTVFTDDDAFPDPGWLRALRAAADEHPACTIFAGAVRPRWESPPPAWLLAWVPLAPVYTLTSPTLPAGPIDAHQVFGPNMAVRSSVFTSGFAFDTRIGPRGVSYAMGSETELVRRLIQHGHRARFVPGATVDHFIRREQMRLGWVVERAVRFGRGQVRLAQTTEPSVPAPAWAGVPRYILGDLMRSAAAGVGGLLALDRERCFRALWDLSVHRGRALEARALRRAR